MVNLEDKTKAEEFVLECAMADGLVYIPVKSFSKVKDGKISTRFGLSPITEVLYRNKESQEMTLSWEEYIKLGQQARLIGKRDYQPIK